MAKFYPEFSLDDLIPADYNPRKILPEGIIALGKSLDTFGPLKPLIATSKGRLLAGHQRRRAAQSLGWKTFPCVILDKSLSRPDEVQLNLAHNSIEMNLPTARVPESEEHTWKMVSWKDIEGTASKEVARSVFVTGVLVGNHGAYGNCIAVAETGDVIANSDYALACKQTRTPLLVRYIPASISVDVAAAMVADYAHYSLTDLNSEAWKQYVIQPSRNSGATGKDPTIKTIKSPTYSNLVLPTLTKEESLLDFGAGKGVMAAKLQKEGFAVDVYEPFQTTKMNNLICFDLPSIISNISTIQQKIEESGLYDNIILDTVINAASDADYQEWMLAAVTLLLKPEGTLHVGTRCLDAEKKKNEALYNPGTKADGNYSYITPEGGGLGRMRGQFFRMNYHTQDSLEELLFRFFGEIETKKSWKTSSLVKAKAKKPKFISAAFAKEALEEEFNPPYPGDFHHDAHKILVRTVLAELKKTEKAKKSNGIAEILPTKNPK